MSEDRAADDADVRPATALRHTLVDELVTAGHVTSAKVGAAFRYSSPTPLRPVVKLEEAYAQDIHRDQAERAGPRDQLGIRVLEIGSGGYKAALIRELVGPWGQVTTVDIDPDITERATGFLQAASAVTGNDHRVRA